MNLSERELEAFQARAREGGMTIAELFERASRTIERNLARLRSDRGETLH